MPYQTIGQMIEDRVRTSPQAPAFSSRTANGWVESDYEHLGQRMQRIAAGLLTAGVELAAGAPIAILGNTSVDWVTCDFAALSVGLQTVPVYATLLPPEVGYLCTDTKSVIAICEDLVQLQKVREMQKGFTFFETETPASDVTIQHIVVIDPAGCTGDDFETLAELEERGASKLEETAEERKRRADEPKRTDTATYTYTSGTTGPPKGVIQTHENMLAMLESIEVFNLFNDRLRSGGFLLFLPLAHSFGRLIELCGPFFNAKIIMSGVPTLIDDLNDTRPGFFPAAPRVYEKMKARIDSGVAGAASHRRALFNWAIGVGKKTIPYRAKGEAIPFFLNAQLGLADRLVLSKIRARLGFDRAELLLSGSAPLNVNVHEFFMACGLNLMEAYGLTETCPGLTANLPNKFQIGSVGIPFPGVEIRIAEDGEIQARGPNITAGYLNRPEATAGAFDSDGWFLTGDLGSQDADGFVKITGRKKELMKTSGGKYIVPAKLEAKLKDLTIVQEAVSIADTRNYVTALVALDPEELEDWAKQNQVDPDPQSEPVKAAVQAHIDQMNTSLARYETIKYFRIVEPMTVESGLLTASLKVKRKVVHDKYADLIEEMYQQRKPS